MLKTNRERLQNTIDLFSQFGATENNGVTRLSLSPEDILARNKFKEICEQLGMTVTVDDMGTMYATLPSNSDNLPIVIGSHLDSVIKGGRFDGVLGVLTALEAVQTIIDEELELNHPITIVNFTNEEGARFEPSLMASGVLSGKFDKEKMLASTDRKGVTFEQALKESGYEGDVANRLTEAHAYLELHIEQGPVLEHYKKEIGVVEGVLGMVCYDITLTGESNHAGTTPISMRKDSMFAAMQIISILQNKLKQLPEDLVYTIGRINAYPNIHTVIPSNVTFSLESRHQDPTVIQQVEQIIFDLPKEIENCELSYQKLWSRDTVYFAPEVVHAVAASTDELGYSRHHMFSGAGHDAQFIAGYIPSTMIFVPSAKGYSHREDEFTSYEECSKGADVLVNAILKVAESSVSPVKSASVK
ncbi:N-carbamoyl-L-amino acid hydrolase [Solibacillus isronensis B3W22]|uniref:N-carbamoyl-L-amino acid hydrolase n=1 Tax=Solibacillus isronensis B3W22 TaxID=1224748 RepID=K1L2L5_9BACL|nr:Zn-dependent hydrolase [Solibacillus isronensis]AMO86814.1 Zn-dependent hydrolase [Solibacillus silvestris]EKB44868.1 N-carbamoyl-L-amino acid hydrolase [Solibacillus isronensis B3W22]